MESTSVVVRSELDEQREIAEARELPNHPLRCALDLFAVLRFPVDGGDDGLDVDLFQLVGCGEFSPRFLDRV